MEPDEFVELVRTAHVATDERLRVVWQRSLSFDDGTFDRWQRAQRLGWGDGTSIYGSSFVLEPVTVGAGVWIGPWVLLDGSGGGITIGDGCHLSAGAHVYTHDTVLKCISGGQVPKRESSVVIGTRTYIGPHAVVAAGVTIGSMCVVGANSLVKDHVPHRTVVAGNPARVVGRIAGDGVTAQIVDW